MNLKPTNQSLLQLKTIHPKFLVSIEKGEFKRNNSVIEAKSAKQPLKPCTSNKKLSGKNKVPLTTKGRWLQMPMFSFTIEERHTCPPYCKFLSNCYGNNLSLIHI